MRLFWDSNSPSCVYYEFSIFKYIVFKIQQYARISSYKEYECILVVKTFSQMYSYIVIISSFKLFIGLFWDLILEA